MTTAASTGLQLPFQTDTSTPASLKSAACNPARPRTRFEDYWLARQSLINYKALKAQAQGQGIRITDLPVNQLINCRFWILHLSIWNLLKGEEGGSLWYWSFMFNGQLIWLVFCQSYTPSSNTEAVDKRALIVIHFWWLGCVHCCVQTNGLAIKGPWLKVLFLGFFLAFTP